MRWFHLVVIALFVAAVGLFAVQNLQLVTMSFLGSERPCRWRFKLVSCTSSVW